MAIWTKSDKYKWLNYDDPEISRIDGKDIVIAGDQPLLLHDRNSQYIRFEDERYHDGIDAMTKTIMIHWIGYNGISGDYNKAINVEYNDEKIRFGWVVPPEAVPVAGVLRIEVAYMGKENGEDYVWHTRTYYKDVENAMGTDSGIVKPGESWYMDFVDLMNEKIATAEKILGMTPGQGSQFADELNALEDVVYNEIPNEYVPTGYGLGESQGKILTAEDNLDTVLKSGIYFWDSDDAPLNVPEQLSYDGNISYPCMMIVYAGSSFMKQQKIISYQYYNCEIVRCFWGNNVSEWEWVNPPMLLGVEYLTTERWQQKPVYCKVIDLGTLENGKIVYLDDIGIDDVVRSFSRAGNSVVPYDSKIEVVHVYFRISWDMIIMECPSNLDGQLSNCTTTLYYTKA